MSSSRGFIPDPFNATRTPSSSNTRTVDPHKMLHDMLQQSPYSRSGRFDIRSRGELVRQLYLSFMQRPEWASLFMLENETPVSARQWNEWVVTNENGVEEQWSLSGFQRHLDEERKRAGLEPHRKIKYGRTCGRVLRRFERTYMCKTCAIDSHCVLCVDCFQASDHTGHEILFGQSYSFAAGCDCGDVTAWRDDKHLGCTHHPRIPLDGPVPQSPQLTNVPDALIRALYNTTVICVEFILQTLQHSPTPNELGNLPNDQEKMQSGEENTGEPADRRGKGPWSVVLWADEKHVVKEVTRQIRDALGCSWETALKWAREVEEVGRKVMLVSHNPITSFHTASMFQQIDLGVTLRPSVDTYREELVGVIIPWFLDMCGTSIGGDVDLFKRILAKVLFEPRAQEGVGQGTPLSGDLRDLEWDKSRYGHESKRLDWLLQLDARLWKSPKWDLRQIYTRFYCFDKEIQKELVSRFAVNYVRLYEQYLFQDREVDMNLIYSVPQLIYGSGPATAYATSRSHLMQTVLDVALAWYTNSIHGNRLVIPIPDVDDMGIPVRVNTSSTPFRGKKSATIFGHVRALFWHKEMQELIMHSSDLFVKAVDFINHFVGMQTQRKESREHIEYEVDWPRSFAILGELAKLCRDLGETAKVANTEQILRAFALVSNRILCDIMLVSKTLDKTKYEPPREIQVANVLTPGSRFTLIDVNVAHITAFSFHHYLHLLLAELIKWIPGALARSEGSFREMSLSDIVELFVLQEPQKPEEIARMKLLLIEWPMQKHVVLSQIRADMWKKNGVAMRGQAHHYREIGIRETTLDQEFFLLQFGLCIMDSFKFMVALIDRFGLSPWFSGDISSELIWTETDIDPKNRINLLEDFLLLVIHLVTDTATINGWTLDQTSRYHIIHQLAVQNLTYSELVKKLPERVTEKQSIAPILAEVANYRQPTETVFGQYSLKAELLAEIDPYWRHYSRNDQRTATEKVLAHLKKVDPFNANPVYMPKPLDIPLPKRLFSNLGDFLHTHVVCDIIHYAIAHCMYIDNPATWPGLTANKNEAPQFDVLLDLALHLALVAIQVDPKNFAEASVQINEQSNAMSIFQNLWFMQTHDSFKAFRPKANLIMDTIVAHLPAEYTVDYRAQLEEKSKNIVMSPGLDAAKAKAAAAIERQKAIMAEFAKKQAAFAAGMDDEEEEDQDMLDETEEEEYGQCIVCQDAVGPKAPGGMLALLQPSRIIREVVNDRDWFEEALLTPSNLDEATRYMRYGMGTTGEPISTDAYPAANHRFGVYMSACSHVMHEACMATYFDATRYRHAQQVQRQHPENAVRSEFLCPLCKSLGNVIIPLDKTTSPSVKHPSAIISAKGRLPTLSESIRRVSEESLLRVNDSARIWDHHVETGELVPWFSDCNMSLHSLAPEVRRGAMRPQSRMIDRVRNLFRPLSEQSQRIRNRKSHMYFPDDVVGYTVAVCEITQRGMAKQSGLSVAEQIPEISAKLIKKLIGMLQLELDLFFGPEFDRTALRVGLFARFLPDWYRASALPSPLLLRNPLGMVVEAAAIAPDLLHAVIVMAYYAELTRSMLGLSLYMKRCLGSRTQPQSRTRPPEDVHLAEAVGVFGDFKGIMQSVLRHAGPFTDVENVLALLSDDMLSKLLYSQTLPFLRRAAIIYRAVAGTYPTTTPDAAPKSGCEYDRLLTLMSVPRPRDVLQNPASTEHPIVARWLNQWAMQGRVVPPLEYPGIYELARMPMLWEDVVIKYKDTRCEHCGTKPSSPALCLSCGKFLCMGGDCCAEGEQGECNLHMRECGAAVGLFADIKRWVLLYLYAGSGSFGHMPYLDSHGELDISMRRGFRQHMHNGRMDELRRGTWLGHSIPHLMARRLELTSDGGGWSCL
ncbi:ubiquitin-protein ligase [Naematelia encephala]|uniref:E3 ubiquitin-protein ligase n=1 Tax=Naematelia encephala TaxID=71784 RepID=A0A1Y2BLZ9_9TREE|nr:ubiquitin-protein ligase [Naematelia encephala]